MLFYNSLFIVACWRSCCHKLTATVLHDIALCYTLLYDSDAGCTQTVVSQKHPLVVSFSANVHRYAIQSLEAGSWYSHISIVAVCDVISSCALTIDNALPHMVSWQQRQSIVEYVCSLYVYILYPIITFVAAL
jgi:hypothetical protein